MRVTFAEIGYPLTLARSPVPGERGPLGGLRRRCTSVPSRKSVDIFPDGASRLTALLLPHICPICSVVTPCQPGAAHRNICHWISDSGH